MFLRERKYWAININSTAIPDRLGLVSSRAGTAAGKRERESSSTTLVKRFPACHRFILPADISHVRADLNGCARRLLSLSLSLYGAIRFHGPKYHTGETRRFVVVFIDLRHLRPMFYDALEAAAASPVIAALPGIAPGCREVLIARHKVSQLYCRWRIIKQKPREIAKGNASAWYRRPVVRNA